MEQDQNAITEKELSIEIDDLCKKFQRFIEIGLESLDTEKIIATLKYKDHEKIKKIEFIYKGTNLSSKRFSPSILIKTNNQKYTWNAGWNFFSSTRDREDIGTLGINLYDISKLEILKVNYNEEDESTISSFEFTPIDLPRVYNAGRNFLNFWFGETKKQETPIELAQSIGEETIFKSTWKILTYSNGKFAIDQDQLPITPKYDHMKSNFSVDDKLAKEWAKFTIVWFVLHFIIRLLSVEKNEEDKSFKEKSKIVRFFKKHNKVTENKDFIQSLFSTLPESSKYRPKRPVDIDSHAIYRHVTEKLEIPWHVISSASAALNAGKHVIFTGPPGCGKTRLAKLIAKQASKFDPLMTTASQSWSTDEVIGRYMPTLNGTGLEFKEGFFLRALNDDKWLIIDEMNRCDIDNCFGELFTVLSGQSVFLPFEKTSEDQQKPRPIHIMVDNDSETEDEANQKYTTINYPESFRLLATMNDADIAGLSQLSYALRRRFAIIRVDAPDDDGKKKIFRRKIDSVYKELKLSDRIYKLSSSKEETKLNYKKEMKNQINNLFACKEKDGIDDLIDLRVVGIAPALDVIKFVSEGLRSSDINKRSIKHEDVENAGKQLVDSFLAMGLVLNVFPQLDAIANEPEIFKKAIKRIVTTFAPEELFLRIEKVKGNKGSKEEILQLTKSNLKIRDYLTLELHRQYSQDSETINRIDEVFDSLNKGSSDKKQETSPVL